MNNMPLLSDFIKNKIDPRMDQMLRAGAKKTELIRLTAPFFGISKAVIITATGVSNVAENVIRGLANVFGSPFSTQCSLLTGVNQLTVGLMKEMVKLPFYVLLAGKNGIEVMFQVAIFPHRWKTLENLLNDNASIELQEFVANCENEDDLVKDSSRLISILANINLENNKPWAARLLYHIRPDDFENDEVKRAATTLRNKGLLNRVKDTDFSLDVGDSSFKAHRSILALESSYFRCFFGEFNESEAGAISAEGFLTARENLYKSDTIYLYE